MFRLCVSIYFLVDFPSRIYLSICVWRGGYFNKNERANVHSLAHMHRLWATNTEWLAAHARKTPSVARTHRTGAEQKLKTVFVRHTPHDRNDYTHTHSRARLSCSRFDDELNTEWFGRIHCKVFFSLLFFLRSLRTFEFVHFVPNLPTACMCALLSRQLLL